MKRTYNDIKYQYRKEKEESHLMFKNNITEDLKFKNLDINLNESIIL